MRPTAIALVIVLLLAGPIAHAAKDPPYHHFVTRKGWEIATWLGEPPSPDMYLSGYLFIDTPGKLYFGLHRTAAAELQPEFATLHFNASGLELANVTLTLPITDAASTGWIYTSIDVAPQPEERGQYSYEHVFHMRNGDGTLTSQQVNMGLAGEYVVIKDPRTVPPPPPSTRVETDEPVTIEEDKPFPWLWIILAVAAAALIAAMIMSRKKKDEKKNERR